MERNLWLIMKVGYFMMLRKRGIWIKNSVNLVSSFCRIHVLGCDRLTKFIGIKGDTFLTVIDEDDENPKGPRVNLVLNVQES